MQYRSANLDYPPAWPRGAGMRARTPSDRHGAAAEPHRVMSVLVLVLVASSSVVMVEPALCDILFPPIFALSLITGHLLSPARLPYAFSGSILVFMLANYLSVLGARDWGYGNAIFYMAVTLYLLVYAAFFALYLGKFGPTGMRWVRDGYQAGAMITAGIAILASLRVLPNSQMFFRDASMLRVQSTFQDPNVFAPFLIGAVFLSLPPLIHSEKLQVRHLVVIALSLGGITLAFSRGAYVHLAVSLAVYVTLEFLVIRDFRANRRLVLGAILVVPLLVLGVGFLLVSTDLGAYMQDRLSLQNYDQKRFSNQFASLLVAQENPLGVGPGQYTGPRFLQDVHNNYLKVLVENGAVGLLAFVTLVGTSIFYGLAGVFRRGRLAPLQAACVGVLLGIMVESIVIDTLHWRHYFLFMGVPVGLTLYERALDRKATAPPTRLHSPGTPPQLSTFEAGRHTGPFA